LRASGVLGGGEHLCRRGGSQVCAPPERASAVLAGTEDTQGARSRMNYRGSGWDRQYQSKTGLARLKYSMMTTYNLYAIKRYGRSDIFNQLFRCC
jgi:hypothetical protein